MNAKACALILLACALFVAQAQAMNARALLAASPVPTRAGPDRPGKSEGTVKSDSAAAVAGARGSKQSCYQIARNGYCDRYSQQNCCESENPSTFFRCSIWDSNYNCPSYKPIMVCCN